MKITEIEVKRIPSKSQVYDYALNPYVGCGHSGVYCYAKFMKRFTGHKEIWGIGISHAELARRPGISVPAVTYPV